MSQDDKDKTQSTTDTIWQGVSGTDCLTGISGLDSIFSTGSTALPSAGTGAVSINPLNTGYPYITVTPTTTPTTPPAAHTYSSNFSGPFWTNSNTSSSSIKVSGDAEIDGDIKLKGRSLTEFLETLEKRLAILQPDPAKLEKFEALKQAYEHYKTLEALCCDNEPKDTK